MSVARDRTRLLEELIEIGIALSSERDLYTLLHRILHRARQFTRAEAGTLYLREGDQVRFGVVQNDVLATHVGEEEMRRLLQETSLPPDHKSLAGHVAVAGEVLNIPDVYALGPDRPFSFNAQIDIRTGYRTRSVLVVPLQDPSGDVLGALQLINARDDQGAIVAFDAAYEDLVRSLASHAAVALRNAQLLAESEARRRSAEALADVGRALSETLDVERVGQLIVDSVRSLLDVKLAVLFWEEPDSGNLVSAAVSGDVVGSLDLNVVLPPGAGIVGFAVRQREPVATEDIVADARIEEMPERYGSVASSAYRAVLAVPLLAKDRVIGALSLRDTTGRSFSATEIRLAQAFGDQAAIALDNARLFRDNLRLLVEMRRQQQEAIALATVAREIASSVKLRDIFQQIVEVAREVCQSDVAILVAYDREMRTAKVGAVSGAGSEALLSLDITPGRGAGGRVLETGEPFQTADSRQDPRLPREAGDMAAREGFVAEAVVPLRFRGSTTGLLWVVNRTRRAFSRAHLAVLTTLADQAAISLENARLHSLLYSAGDGICGVGHDGQITFVNPAAAKMMGSRPEELVGQLMHAVVRHSRPDGTPYPGVADPIRAVLVDGMTRYVDDEVFWRKDGQSFGVEYLVTPIIEGGEIVGAAMTFRDITERRRTVHAMREAQALRSVASLAAAARPRSAIR